MKNFLQKRKGFLFVKNLKEEIKPIKSLLENLEIKKIDPQEDLDSLEISKELKKKIELNLGANKEVFVGITDKKVVYTSFIDYNHSIGIILFGDFTLTEYRGKYVSPTVKSEIFRYLKNKGIKKVYISCARGNLSSKASILRAGFKKLNLWQRIIVKVKIWIKKAKFIIFT